jgi:hypothetical protein
LIDSSLKVADEFVTAIPAHSPSGRGSTMVHGLSGLGTGDYTSSS